MHIVVLQLVLAIVALTFGAAALLAGYYVVEPNDVRRRAWIVTGLAFVISGAVSLVQATWAAWAFRSGPDSQLWMQFIRWAPAGNHSRTFGKLAWGAALAFLPWLQNFSARMTIVMVGSVLILAVLTGGVVGWMEGSFVDGTHYGWVAVLNNLELVAVLAAVIIALLLGSMDWLLWLAVCIYALRLAINVIWSVGRVSFHVPDAWLPPLWINLVIGITAYFLLIALALRRIDLARRGVYVPALLELLDERPASAIR